MTGPSDHWITTRVATPIVAAVFTLLFLMSLLVYPQVQASFVKNAQVAAKSTLRLVSGAVDQAIGKYQPIPGLIADDPIFRDLLHQTGNNGIVPFVNEKLRHIAGSVGASDIYIMDPSGTTVAASNYRDEGSFMGNNFAYRPYFQDALAGKATQFHALGTTSGERGFFFSVPILDGISVIGVLALKVTVELFEGAWSGSPLEIIVADPNGVAFLSSHDDYRLRSLAPLSDGVRARIAETRQFPLNAVTPIPFSANVIAPSAVEVTLGEAGSEIHYLAESEPLSLSGWHAIVLTPLGPITSQAIYALIVWNLATGAIALAALALIQRRARIFERIRVEQTQRDLLERMVQERTADLDTANISLRSEVNERKIAEERLRKTQKDLVQAGKLAALGQMSAALSHEINQPLAAVKSYADNAALYIERNRTTEAKANIARISEMADRMANISRHLRNFARRPGDKLNAIPVCEVIREAVALMDPQVRKSGSRISFASGQTEYWVLGGRLRLQQVLVNIMTNAIDAMEGQSQKLMDISIDCAGDTVAIHVRDHGPGLKQDALNQAFEAFFTTKEAGAGMGLGLSISYNIIEDFGGKFTASNHPDGGGVFTVELRRAPSRDLPSAQVAAQ
jgi:two-component system C4-dicarboxylate transport sensor histidine kinase DctB